MTQVIGRPIDGLTKLIREPLTREQAKNARSLDNLYRVALHNINNRTHIQVRMGKSIKKIPPTDLMVILRDVKNRLEQGISQQDFGFLYGTLRWLRYANKSRGIIVSVQTLMQLRKIAYAEQTLPVEEPPEPPPSRKRQVRHLLALDNINKKRAADKKVPPLAGCRYQDLGTGERCGTPCEGAYCDSHKNAPAPVYNGRGSRFHALGLKESGMK